MYDIDYNGWTETESDTGSVWHNVCSCGLPISARITGFLYASPTFCITHGEGSSAIAKDCGWTYKNYPNVRPPFTDPLLDVITMEAHILAHEIHLGRHPDEGLI